MFAYCYNIPIIYYDNGGTRPIVGDSIQHETITERELSFATMNNKLGTASFSVGAAQPFIEMSGSIDPRSPNCYSYAIGSSVNEQPGNTSGIKPSHMNDVYDVGKSVREDLLMKGFTVRQISGPDEKIYVNEYKIALRVGTTPFNNRGDYDYHFMRQTDTGQWAEKHGIIGDAICWDYGMTPNNIPWTLGGRSYYDSDIIYFAVGR